MLLSKYNILILSDCVIVIYLFITCLKHLLFVPEKIAIEDLWRETGQESVLVQVRKMELV